MCSKSEQKFIFMTKLQLSNLHQPVVNISNSNNIDKFLVPSPLHIVCHWVKSFIPPPVRIVRHYFCNHRLASILSTQLLFLRRVWHHLPTVDSTLSEEKASSNRWHHSQASSLQKQHGAREWVSALSDKGGQWSDSGPISKAGNNWKTVCMAFLWFWPIYWFHFGKIFLHSFPLADQEAILKLEGKW